MAQGTVKWFRTEKGFGFINDGGEEEIFVHYVDLEVKKVCPTCGQEVRK